VCVLVAIGRRGVDVRQMVRQLKEKIVAKMKGLMIR
jgi:F0F1-type ATP synthase alpha subunit